MEREIFFRGFSQELKMWIYGDLVRDCVNAFSQIIGWGIQKPGNYPDEVLPESAGQFIGEIKGVKIFQGDVISGQLIEGEIVGYEVIWSDVWFQYGIEYCGGIYSLYEIDNLKVIGNKFEHKHLLNQ